MRINVDVNKIPYEFKLKCIDRIFILNFKHFISDNSIYIDLIDEDGDYQLENEKLIFGRAIGFYIQKDDQNNINPYMQQAYIIPLNEHNNPCRITLETLGKSVFLEYFEINQNGEFINE
ncbi:MAG: hypothetical protein KBF12_02875 [Sebaldella sp.]|nr:hypothetical protein [Sebaldella sp.]